MPCLLVNNCWHFRGLAVSIFRVCVLWGGRPLWNIGNCYQSMQDNISEDLDSGFYFVTTFFKSFCKKYIAYMLLYFFSTIWPITPQCRPCCMPFTMYNNSINFFIECIIYVNGKDITKVTWAALFTKQNRSKSDQRNWQIWYGSPIVGYSYVCETQKLVMTEMTGILQILQLPELDTYMKLLSSCY